MKMFGEMTMPCAKRTSLNLFVSMMVPCLRISLKDGGHKDIVQKIMIRYDTKLHPQTSKVKSFSTSDNC